MSGKKCQIKTFWEEITSTYCCCSEESAFKSEVYDKEENEEFKEFLTYLVTKNKIKLINKNEHFLISLSREERELLHRLRTPYQNDEKGLYKHVYIGLVYKKTYITLMLKYLPMMKKQNRLFKN